MPTYDKTTFQTVVFGEVQSKAAARQLTARFRTSLPFHDPVHAFYGRNIRWCGSGDSGVYNLLFVHVILLQIRGWCNCNIVALWKISARFLQAKKARAETLAGVPVRRICCPGRK
jgi:hypothetical protein